MSTTSFTNCEHINNGWCLVCVSELNRQLAAAEQERDERAADKKWYNESMALIQTRLEAADKCVEELKELPTSTENGNDNHWKWKKQRILKRYDTTKLSDITPSNEQLSEMAKRSTPPANLASVDDDWDAETEETQI